FPSTAGARSSILIAPPCSPTTQSLLAFGTTCTRRIAIRPIISELRLTRSTDFEDACDHASMKARYLYLICCVLGLLLPYWQFVPWLLEHGLNITLFFHELFANQISAF